MNNGYDRNAINQTNAAHADFAIGLAVINKGQHRAFKNALGGFKPDTVFGNVARFLASSHSNGMHLRNHKRSYKSSLFKGLLHGLQERPPCKIPQYLPH